MLQMKHLPKTVVIAITILLAVAVSTPVLHTQAANTQRAAIQSTTRTDLAQRDLLSRPLLDSSFTSTRNVEGKSAFLRTCRCSCGFPCKTNADCGPGGVCAAGITCCNVGTKNDGLLAEAKAACSLVAARRGC